MLIATYRLVRVKEKTKAYTDKAKNTKQSDIPDIQRVKRKMGAKLPELHADCHIQTC